MMAENTLYLQICSIQILIKNKTTVFHVNDTASHLVATV